MEACLSKDSRSHCGAITCQPNSIFVFTTNNIARPLNGLKELQSNNIAGIFYLSLRLFMTRAN